jgi:hypothetical protein
MLKWRKWTDEEKDKTLCFHSYSCDLNRSINMGIFTKPARDAYPVDCAYGNATSIIVQMMSRSNFPSRNIFILGAVLALFFASIACALGSSSPSLASAPGAPAPTELLPMVAEPTSQPSQTAAVPAIPETRRLTLEFPSRMRAGVEGDVVRLTLEVDDLGNITPTAQIAGNTVVGKTIEIPDLYETHNVTAEARLDLAGVLVQPPDATFEPLKRGQSAMFYWSIRPQEAGIYRGTVWLHLNFEDKSTGEKSRIAVSAQLIEIEAVDFFGLSVNFARTSGVIGSIVGGVVGFPFIEDILKFLIKRRKKA